MSAWNLSDPEAQVLMLIETIELRAECEDCGKMSFGVMLMEGCPYCAPKKNLDNAFAKAFL